MHSIGVSVHGTINRTLGVPVAFSMKVWTGVGLGILADAGSSLDFFPSLPRLLSGAGNYYCW